MKSFEELLGENPLTSLLTPSQAAKLRSCSTEKEFPADKLIFWTGSSADEFYLLRSGTVALEVHLPNKKELAIQTLRGGDILGWSWLFPPFRWHFDARAQEPVSAFAVNAAEVRAQCEADHEFGYRLLQGFSQALADRLHATRLQLLDLYGKHG